MKILIDNLYYEVSPGKNLLEVCISLGLNVPYFCYHPAMGSVGACRQCAVKKFANAEDKTGRIVMACMEPVTEGMIVSVEDADARDFRAAVIEGLMTNHPHDCPICDEGGECHLQDMTVMTGHNYRRFPFKKRTYLNQNLGPFIQHEMNRCIQCYRCVRFYRDYAGGRDLNVYGSANKVYFGRQEDGTLESEFSGNLVEVCPTGVFTDKTLKRHFTRKWDLTHAPSVCVHCSLGCNILLGERYGSVRRVMNRYNGEVNGYFLCDRGRFGYEFIHQPQRISSIHVVQPGGVSSEQQDPVTTLSALANDLKSGKVIGIGSPRASVESNFALQQLAGKDRFFLGISRNEQQLVNKALNLLNSNLVHAPSLHEIEQCDAIFILGEDITQTAPVMALSIRQATRNRPLEIAEKSGIPRWNDTPARDLTQDIRSPLYIANPFSTKLDDVATESIHAVPGDIARLGFAVARSIDPGAPAVPGIDERLTEIAEKIAASLLDAKQPLIVTGISCANEDLLNAVIQMAIALSGKNKKPRVAIAFLESNTAGIGLMNGGNLDDALELISNNLADTLIVLENDLYRRIPREKIDTAFSKCRKIIALDHTMNPTTAKAHVVLPVATYAESPGTIVNYEGRAQRYYPVLPVREPARESWRWMIDLLKATGKDPQLHWEHFDDVVNSLVNYYPVFAGIKNSFPPADYRINNEKIARQTMRFSGRTAITADVSVSEPKPPEDRESPLNYSMEGYKGDPPSNLIPYYWRPGWNSPQAVNQYLNEPNGSVRGADPGFRLPDKKEDTPLEYIKNIPEAFHAARNELFIVPVHRIFGSEELSSFGQAIRERIPETFLLMNSRESGRWKVNSSDLFRVVVNNSSFKVHIITDETMPDGVAGLSVLFPGIEYAELPGLGRITDLTQDR
jgi:NADH-quinone oxidoreductase subunit G